MIPPTTPPAIAAVLRLCEGAEVACDDAEAEETGRAVGDDDTDDVGSRTKSGL